MLPRNPTRHYMLCRELADGLRPFFEQNALSFNEWRKQDDHHDFVFLNRLFAILLAFDPKTGRLKVDDFTPSSCTPGPACCHHQVREATAAIVTALDTATYLGGDSDDSETTFMRIMRVLYFDTHRQIFVDLYAQALAKLREVSQTVRNRLLKSPDQTAYDRLLQHVSEYRDAELAKFTLDQIDVAVTDRFFRKLYELAEASRDVPKNAHPIYDLEGFTHLRLV